MDAIIQCLKSRTGAYGEQRKQLVNNLFKGIVDLSFPNFVKYLFWGATNNSGVFQAEDSIDKHEATYKNSVNEL